ncbi:chaperone NapD [Selenomonas ruminantium]|uniref:chaperone NapD n=1 Tax=Selenomonas ruminantium TaxID=971 RepID=UPI00210B41A8|nr:chaperone NapD [Selenomonas ruminantium]
MLKMKDGAEEKLRASLTEIPGISVESKAPSGELIVLVETADINGLHKQCLEIERMEGVLGVYPSYITTEDEAMAVEK